MLCTLVGPAAGPEGMLGAALGLRSCSFTAETLAASAGGSPPGTNSAAVGFRAPLLGAGFSPGTWGTVQACQEDQRCCGKTGKLEAAQQPLRSRVLGRKRWDSPPRGDGAAMPSR